MTREEISIPIDHADLPAVSGIVDRPEEPTGRSGVLLAHGAGAAMKSAFIEDVATGLAARGLPVLRFNYAYSERATREGKRRPPDRMPTLLAVHRRAIAVARKTLGTPTLLLAGKSMGGRMASVLAAEGEDAAGLVYLGYPLHPAGKPERLRREHFPAIAQPTLFLQGTRDALCDLELLRPALETYGGAVELHVVEGADHDFRVLKRSGRTNDEVLAEILDAIDAWEAASFPARRARGRGGPGRGD